MLESMRRGAKSWVAKGLILLLIASFAVWGISDVFSTSPSSAIATVGDRTVTFETYSTELQRARNRMSQEAGRAISYAEMRQTGVDQILLAQLMRERAVATELERLGITAPDEAVAEAIREVPAFQTGDGSFSPDRYRFVLGRQGYSPAEFEALSRFELGQRILTTAARGTGRTPPGMAARIAAHQGEQRRMVSVILSPDRAPDPGTPSASDLEARWADNQAAYTEPERRSGVYLHMSIEELAEELRPTEQEIADWYADNAETLGTPATRTLDQLPLPRNRADALAARIRGGEISFEDLARELGENPADLDLGAVGRDDLPDAVAAAVFAATEPGIVGPVDAPIGPVLIRLRAVNLGGTPSLEEARAEIADRLARDLAYERAPEIANDIDDLRAEGRTLDEIAEETGLALTRFEGLARDGSLPQGQAEGLMASETFRQEVFAALDHEERDILETDAGGFFIVLVERIAEAHVVALEQIRDRVAEDWAAGERLAALEAEGREIAERLTGPAQLADWAREEGLEVREQGPFRRDAPPFGLPFTATPELFALDEGAAAAIPLSGGRGVLLAEIVEVVPLPTDQLADLAGRVETAVAGQIASDQAELFLRAVETGVPAEIDIDGVQAVFDHLGARSGG